MQETGNFCFRAKAPFQQGCVLSGDQSHRSSLINLPASEPYLGDSHWEPGRYMVNFSIHARLMAIAKLSFNVLVLIFR